MSVPNIWYNFSLIRLKNNFILKTIFMLMIKSNQSPSIKHFFDIFDDIFEPVFLDDNSVNRPLHDVIENDNEFILDLQLPGIKKEDINITVNKNKLIIEAERNENKDLKYNRKETFYGKFEKSFTLPDIADIEKITSSLNDGILTVILPKKLNGENSGIKKIEIL